MPLWVIPLPLWVIPRSPTTRRSPQWRSARSHWPAGLPVGVTLDNDDEVADLADDVDRLALVELRFPKWTELC